MIDIHPLYFIVNFIVKINQGKEDIKMTYKNMLAGIIERDCQKWVESFISKDSKAFTCGDKTTLKIEDGTCYFNSEIDVYSGCLHKLCYIVGGTICENGHIYKSVIKNESGKIVWASTSELREIEGITEFQIK